MVVIFFPGAGLLPGGRYVLEGLPVEEFIHQLRMEALRVTVLPRAAGSDIQRFDLQAAQPRLDRFGDKLRAVVTADGPRHTALNDEATKDVVAARRKFGYVPFEGHQSRLGHYYRHLYQTVRYVDQQPFLTDKEKYDYVKTIRAQLSTHEQALLLIDALSPLGRKWFDDHFISKYRMVKNIPRNFFVNASELDISSLNLPIAYFEWEEGKGVAATDQNTRVVNPTQ